MTTFRLCCFGDSLTNGRGDAAFLGWPGRICAAAATEGHVITLYNLGVRGETSAQIAARWRAECECRLPGDGSGRLIFSFGLNDLAEVRPGVTRMRLIESLHVAREMILTAKDGWPTLWIGPPPVWEAAQPLAAAGATREADQPNRRILEMNEEFQILATATGVPYLDLCTPLHDDPVWIAALQAGDGVHPTAAGYARLAELVAGWEGWRAWLA